MAEKSTITELNLVWYSNGIQSTGPFRIQTTFDYSNTALVWYSDPHYDNLDVCRDNELV